MGVYADFGDFPGSCTIEPHVDWMELESFGHDIDRPYGVGGQWDPADIGDFKMVKLNDKSSPKLIQAILSGTCFDKVKIEFTTTTGGEDEVPVYTLELEKVRITGYGLDGKKIGACEEVVAVYADKATWTYFVQDEESGSGEVTYGYDIKSRTAA